MTEKNDVDIRYYQPGDDEGIVELLKKTFPKWAEFKDPMELWRWKYINIPLTHLIIVAVVDNKIVGCSHSLFFNAKLGSEVTSLGYGDDLAIDTDYRGLGIWPKLENKKYKTLSNLAKFHLLTTSNPRVKENWAKRNRSFLPFSVTRMVKTRDINLQLAERPMKNSFLVKLGYFGLKVSNRITNIFRTPIRRLGEFKITKVSEFDKSIDLFWMKIKDDYNFIIEKKHEYLNWRFTDNDRGNHVIFQAVNNEEVLGYMVVGFKEGSSEAQIEDLLALKDRVDVVDALFDYGCEYLDGIGVNTVYYQVVVDHPYQAHSRRHGFIDSRSRPIISLDYSDYWDKPGEVPFLEHTAPSQVYFNYATTV